MPTVRELTADQKAAECLKFIQTILTGLPPSPSKEETAAAYLCGALCVALYFAMPELTGKLREAGARIGFAADGGFVFQSPTVILPTPPRGPRLAP